MEHPKKAAFLVAYARCGIVATACRYAEVARVTYYRWMEQDEDFAVRVGLAKAEAADYVEEVALERATIGHQVVKEVYERGADGGLVLVRREVSHQVSDTMLAMMLNGAKPEKYKIRQEVQHAGPVIKAVERDFWEAV